MVNAGRIADAIEDVRKLSQFVGAIAALRMALMANAFLEAEIDRLSAAISSGFLRGVRNPPHRKKLSRKNTH
jgi:hypothetical protein